jgi:predicted transcriptional regulator
MRTLVDIPDADVQALDGVAKQNDQPRAALIREAIAEYLARHRRSDATAAFGLWATAEDGLAYQNRLRSEW